MVLWRRLRRRHRCYIFTIRYVIYYVLSDVHNMNSPMEQAKQEAADHPKKLPHSLKCFNLFVLLPLFEAAHCGRDSQVSFSSCFPYVRASCFPSMRASCKDYCILYSPTMLSLCLLSKQIVLRNVNLVHCDLSLDVWYKLQYENILSSCLNH